MTAPAPGTVLLALLPLAGYIGGRRPMFLTRKLPTRLPPTLVVGHPDRSEPDVYVLCVFRRDLGLVVYREQGRV